MTSRLNYFQDQKEIRNRVSKGLVAANGVMSNSRDYWNMFQLPPADTMFKVDEIKYEIKTSTIPNAGEPGNECTVALPQGLCALAGWVTQGEKIWETTLFLWQQETTNCAKYLTLSSEWPSL